MTETSKMHILNMLYGRHKGLIGTCAELDNLVMSLSPEITCCQNKFLPLKP